MEYSSSGKIITAVVDGETMTIAEAASETWAKSIVASLNQNNMREKVIAGMNHIYDDFCKCDDCVYARANRP